MSKRQGYRCVSVLVPVRNARGRIESFCQSVLNQILPEGWSLELIVADARSTDGTREFLQVLSLRDPRLRLIESPRRSEAAGLNAALRASVGDVIVRMDVHTDYSADYVHQALRALSESGADHVGGPWRVRPALSDDSMQCAIAVVSQALGVAGSESCSAGYNGWVQAVHSGCWPRSTFERFGGFDDRLARLHDEEHDLRVTRGGGLIWQSSRLRSVRCSGLSFSDFFHENLRQGYWKPFLLRKHRKFPGLNDMMGSVWVLVAMLLSLPLGALASSWWPLVLAGTALVFLLVHSMGRAWRGQSSVYGVGVLLRLPWVLGACHLARGLGFLMGAWSLLRRRKLRFRVAPQAR